MRDCSRHRTGVYVFLVGAWGIVGLIFAFAISMDARYARRLPNMPDWSERQLAMRFAAQD